MVNIMKITIVIILYLCVIFIDYRRILHQKRKNLSIFYGVVLIITFSIIFLHKLDVEIPSPSLMIKDLIEKIF